LTLTERKFVFTRGICGKAAGANLSITRKHAKWTPFGECACSTSVHERTVPEYQRFPRPLDENPAF
jgi:hypothetical protein